MGSSGSGTLGNYQPPESEKCDESINTGLEEVAREEYFSNHGGLPPVGTNVRLRAGPIKGRLVVETSKKPESLGLIPTSFNYLVLCLKKGYTYEGEVTESRGKRSPVIIVSLVADKR